MKNNGNKLNYLLIVIGASIAIYAKAESAQNTIILIIGIIMLMYGTYSLSSSIPSKKEKNTNHFIEEEKEE